MDAELFWILHRILFPYLGSNIQPLSSSKKKNCNGAKNGLIPSTLCLSMALCYFAGGSAYDIALVHGVAYTKVFKSLWKVVNLP